MVPKLLADIAHYYNERGRGEIASFVQSWIISFSALFAVFASNDLQSLFNGAIEKDIDALFYGFLLAFARSALGALIFALCPKKWRESLLRTPDKK